MRLRDIVDILKGRAVCGEDRLDMEIDYAYASDLMSDVLTTQAEKMVLLTGLSNVQVIRTAEMSDVSCVVFVRNKKATNEMIELACEGGIVLIECPWSMYRASGELYKLGLKPIF